jgi:hypothetical protein
MAALAPFSRWWPFVPALALCASALFYVAPRYWRGDLGRISEQVDAPNGWLLTRPVRRGLVRAIPIISLIGMISTILFLIPTIFMVGEVTTAWRVYGAATLGIFFGGMGAALSIVFVNRPRSLVPPPWRNQVGVLSEWLAKRETRRAGSASSGKHQIRRHDPPRLLEARERRLLDHLLAEAFAGRDGLVGQLPSLVVHADCSACPTLEFKPPEAGRTDVKRRIPVEAQ